MSGNGSEFVTSAALRRAGGRNGDQYIVGAPMERLVIVILWPLPLTPRGNRYVLVVTDYFTKWTKSYVIPNQEVDSCRSS